MKRTTITLAALLLFSIPLAVPREVLAQPYPLTPAPAPVPPGTPAVRPSLTQIFQWLDINHDGFLTLDEFLAAPWAKKKAQATKFFYWMDTNKDGRVSLAEFLAAYKLYSGPNGVVYRTTYPWAWTYWRPWRYGWAWHAASWRPGWNGGWYHRPRSAYAVASRNRIVHVRHPAKHPKRVKHPKARKAKHRKHPVRHAKAHKAKHRGKSKGHKARGHKGHGHHR